MTVVSDTSPINYLILTEYVGVLHELYGQIAIPGKVFEELSSGGAPAIVRTRVLCSARLGPRNGAD